MNLSFFDLFCLGFCFYNKLERIEEAIMSLKKNGDVNISLMINLLIQLYKGSFFTTSLDGTRCPLIEKIKIKPLF